MPTFIQSAFEQVCSEAKKPETWYVILVETHQAYGGPEEGGWWYPRNELVAYQEFASESLAEDAAEKVKELADELKRDAQRSHGEHCLRQMEWLDARGLDADYLPEDDGPSDFLVSVTQELPQFNNSRPHYE